MEKLRLKLIEDINASGLPLEAIVFVVRDVYRDAQETYQKYQLAQQTQTTEEKKEDIDHQ
jgi:hypothetical protein